MKVVIIFHSVCGNTFLMAKAFELALINSGHNVVLKRVIDADWIEKTDLPTAVSNLLRTINSIPEAKPEDLLNADIILMGGPVYFGNVSAELKAFMDSTGGLWFQGKLTGKKFAAFVSAGNSEGGGDLALRALHTYAAYMGMVSLPVSSRILPGENINALGVIQYSNGKYSTELDDKSTRLIEQWCRSFEV